MKNTLRKQCPSSSSSTYSCLQVGSFSQCTPSHRLRPCTCASRASIFDMPACKERPREGVSRALSKESILLSPCASHETLPYRAMCMMHACGPCTFTTQRASPRQPPSPTVPQEGASLLHMRYVVCVAEPAVAAELLCWVLAARFYRLSLGPPVMAQRGCAAAAAAAAAACYGSHMGPGGG